MLSQRLSIALDSGLVDLPDAGRIAVIEPAADSDLSMLPMEQVTVVSRQYPAHSRFKAMGYATSTKLEGPFELALISLPRAKDEARALVFQASVETTGALIVDGQKTDGVESMLKELRRRGQVEDVVIKAHGKLFMVNDVSCADWSTLVQKVTHKGTTFQTAPGVFSADGVDPGSVALSEALPRDLKGHVIDLGAGWGFLAQAVLGSDRLTQLDLVEADFWALDAARQNVKDQRAHFHWNDARHFTSELADHVICNPPFHTGRATDPALGQSFIQAAARLLKPRGQLWLVANRHLPYEKTLESAFREVRTLSEIGGYKLTHAQAPRTSRKG